MSSVVWVTRRCYEDDCNGVFRVKKDSHKVICPYCGSKRIGKQVGRYGTDKHLGVIKDGKIQSGDKK